MIRRPDEEARDLVRSTYTILFGILYSLIEGARLLWPRNVNSILFKNPIREIGIYWGPPLLTHLGILCSLDKGANVRTQMDVPSLTCISQLYLIWIPNDRVNLLRPTSINLFDLIIWLCLDKSTNCWTRTRLHNPGKKIKIHAIFIHFYKSNSYK